MSKNPCSCCGECNYLVFDSEVFSICEDCIGKENSCEFLTEENVNKLSEKELLKLICFYSISVIELLKVENITDEIILKAFCISVWSMFYLFSRKEDDFLNEKCLNIFNTRYFLPAVNSSNRYYNLVNYKTNYYNEFVCGILKAFNKTEQEILELLSIDTSIAGGIKESEMTSAIQNFLRLATL